MTNYPNNLDDNTSLPPAFGTDKNPINALREAVFAIETELGLNPKGAYADTRTRIDILEARLNSSGTVRVVGTPSAGQAIIWNGSSWIPSTNFLNQSITLGGSIIQNGTTGVSVSSSGQGILYYDSILNKFRISENGGSFVDITGNAFTAAGDLSGNNLSQTVIGLQQRSVADIVPTDGYALTWNESNNRWEPQIQSGGFSANGDLSGNSTNQTVIGLQTTPINNSTPSSNNALVYDGSQWTPTQLTLDPELIGPAFAITLSGGTLVEVSQTVTNPSFTATKNYTGTAALLSNNDNAESKDVLTEFNASTSFTSDFSYIKNTYGATVIFTLTANKNAIVRTATSTYTWVQKVYRGVATAGQTGEAFIESLTGALQTTKNGSYSFTAGLTQKIYFAWRFGFGLATFTIGGFSGGITFHSDNLTGITTFTNGSTSVTGSGTSFLSEVIAGDYIRLSTGTESSYAQVASVSTDTALTLVSNYQGASGSGTGIKVRRVSVTNANGFTEDYLEAESDNLGLGSTTVVVSTF